MNAQTPLELDEQSNLSTLADRDQCSASRDE